MSIAVMKQALEFANDIMRGKYKGNSAEIGDALRLAIEQAERQEPAAWCEIHQHYKRCEHNTPPKQEKQEPHYLHCICGAGWEISADGGEELVDTPPQRQPLTGEEILDLWKQVYEPGHQLHVLANALARAIERAHGIGGKHD